MSDMKREKKRENNVGRDLEFLNEWRPPAMASKSHGCATDSWASHGHGHPG